MKRTGQLRALVGGVGQAAHHQLRRSRLRIANETVSTNSDIAQWPVQRWIEAAIRVTLSGSFDFLLLRHPVDGNYQNLCVGHPEPPGERFELFYRLLWKAVTGGLHFSTVTQFAVHRKEIYA